MRPDDMRALEQQYKRIYAYLHLGGQSCLLRTLKNDWRAADTWQQKSDVVARWMRDIVDAEIILFGADEDDDDA